eukprot:gene561-5965_t
MVGALALDAVFGVERSPAPHPRELQPASVDDASSHPPLLRWRAECAVCAAAALEDALEVQRPGKQGCLELLGIVEGIYDREQMRSAYAARLSALSFDKEMEDDADDGGAPMMLEKAENSDLTALKTSPASGGKQNTIEPEVDAAIVKAPPWPSLPSWCGEGRFPSKATAFPEMWRTLPGCVLRGPVDHPCCPALANYHLCSILGMLKP